MQIRPTDDQILGELEKLYRARGIFIAPENLALQSIEIAEWPPVQQETVQVKLQPQEQRLCQAILNIPDTLEPDQFIAVEIEQIANAEEQNERVGSIGIIAFAHPV
ncbi:MAG: hypothetical protein WBM44_28650 [Waterburya sp.]